MNPVPHTRPIVYLPSALSESRGFRQDLRRLALFATSKKVANWIDDAERNLPKVEGDSISKEEVLDVWGGKKDVGLDNDNHFLTTSDGWRKLGEWGAREGFVNTSLPLIDFRYTKHFSSSVL